MFAHRGSQSCQVARHLPCQWSNQSADTEVVICQRQSHHSGTCASWRGKSLRVQKIRPSILGCNILRVEYSLLIYVSVPGSKKVILDLPLVIGSRSGLSSRTSSMASRTSSEMSWIDLNIPDTQKLLAIWISFLKITDWRAPLLLY